MKNFKLALLSTFILSVIAGGVMAGSIKVWSNGQTLTASDLNANFAHIHGLMVGGHGPRLVDADVSGSAAIQSSKLSQGAGIADGWAYLSGTCAAGTCTLSNSYGVSSVTWQATGQYYVNTSATIAAGAVCHAEWVNQTASTEGCNCDYQNSTRLSVVCGSGGVPTNAQFKLSFFSN